MNWSISVSILFCVACLQNVLIKAEVAEKSCKAVMGDLTKRQLSALATCGKSLNFKGKEKSKKMNCIMACGMQNEGLISKAGKIDTAQIDILLEKNFPASLVDKANATFIPCIEKGAGIDPNMATDPYCATYDPIIKCLMGAFPNLCVGMP